ncbi:MAG: rSAM-partnered protein [Natronomonas sp.]|jgi:rSAM-partnered protein
MVEKPVHYRVEHQPREGDPSWEVFVRDDPDDQLRHVGSMPAPNARAAYNQARRLFGWFVHDLWVCPASDIHRFEVDPPSATTEAVEGPTGDEGRTHEI